MTNQKFTIRIGEQTVTVGDAINANHLDYGYSRTLDRAIDRAEKLTRSTRTDMAVYVEDGDHVVAVSGCNDGPAGFIRPLVR